MGALGELFDYNLVLIQDDNKAVGGMILETARQLVPAHPGNVDVRPYGRFDFNLPFNGVLKNGVSSVVKSDLQ